MKEAMKEVAKMAVDLTVEERNLLSVAYKNVIGARRASWRIISSIEQKEEQKCPDGEKAKCVTKYRDQVQRCSDFQNLKIFSTVCNGYMFFLYICEVNQ